MSLLAKASAEGLNISTIKATVKKVCQQKLESLGFSRPETITKLKCHELAQLIGDNLVYQNDTLAIVLKNSSDFATPDAEGNVTITDKEIKARNHANTQVLYGCQHGTFFWLDNKKYLKSGNNWLHVSTYNPNEKKGAQRKLNTKGFYLYKGLRYDVAKSLGVDLSQTLNEILDEILK